MAAKLQKIITKPGIYKRRTAGFSWVKKLEEAQVVDANSYNTFTQRLVVLRLVNNPESEFISPSINSWKTNFLKKRKENFARYLKKKLNEFTY